MFEYFKLKRRDCNQWTLVFNSQTAREQTIKREVIWLVLTKCNLALKLDRTI
ncbi:MAG: hypothetical protein ACTS45_00775 [Candidatus Hodgkinia cicadicola]